MNTNDQTFMAQKIRTQYMEKESTQLDALRALDAKVKRPANVFAGVFGTVSALILGFGMSLVMTDIGASLGFGKMALTAGIVIGVAGMALTGIAYPLHFRVLKKERAKIAPEVLRLTDELIK